MDLKEDLVKIFKKVDLGRSKPAPKTILVDLFGIPKTFKTSITVNLDRIFRRTGMNVFFPPETAEHELIRSCLTEDMGIFQAQHVYGVMGHILKYGYNRDFPMVMISRGPIDMLYWYEKHLSKGRCSETHVDRARNFIYALLEFDLVDCFFFLTSSVEVAMKRNYESSLTQERGSCMNEDNIAKAIGLYEKVLDGVDKNVSRKLPIFRVDTSDMDVKQASEEVLRLLVPKIKERFNI